jgi:predicted MFS family arabinose efflux permease
MNTTIKVLMLSDMFVLTGFGLIDPILAIFIKENLIGGTILAAGVASMLFLVTKSMLQLPFSRYVDRHDDKKKLLIMGTFLISVVPFMYIMARDITAIWMAQILYGIGSGMAYPTWLGLWSTHLDTRHESFEWSLYSTATSLGIGVVAIIGATIAEFVSFTYVFLLVGALSFMGCMSLFALERKEKLHKLHIHHYHRKMFFNKGF